MIALALALPTAIIIWFTTKLQKQIIVCISVDADLLSDKQKSRQSIKLTESILEQYLKPSQVTWFINEGDFSWSEEYREDLERLSQKGYDIQLHSHYIEQVVNNPEKSLDEQDIKEELEQQKEAVESVIDKPIIGFRAGKHVLKGQHKVLKEAGFKFDSSEYPGVRFLYNNQYQPDFRDIPFSKNIYKKDGILVFPCHVFYAPKLYVQCLLYGRSPIVITRLFHPRELIVGGVIRRTTLKIQLLLSQWFFSDKRYMNMRKAYQKLK